MTTTNTAPRIEVEATARPWGTGDNLKGFIYSKQTGDCIAVANVAEGMITKTQAEANAALIVRSVNSHQALVEAVKLALTTPGMIKGRDALEAALKLAGE